MKIVYADMCEGAAVIVDGTTIYHEDDDKGHHQYFSARHVARRLAGVVNCEVIDIHIPDEKVPVDWDFGWIETYVNNLTGGRT